MFFTRWRLTDDSEQNNTGPLGGPVINEDDVYISTAVAIHYFLSY